MLERESSVDYAWKIRIRSAAHLDYWIEDYFGGLKISHELDGSSLITGELLDLPAVYGLILQLRDAGIYLLALQVERIEHTCQVCKNNNEEDKHE